MNNKIKWKEVTAILFVAMMLASVFAIQLTSAFVSSRTYTLDADFDEGILFGVEHETVHDQLQLSKEVTTFPIMWIANAGEDTVSKWDTNNNKELARYRTWFGPAGQPGYYNHLGNAWAGASPSRTAVDLEGNCYVANRHFDNRPADVIKILANDWIDRNSNGVMDTSSDLNNDGTITPDEMLPMADTNGNGRIDPSEIQDERIAWVVSIGPNDGLGRSMAIAPNGDIWLGLYNSKVYYRLSGVDGSILAGPIDVSPNTPYGALVDKNGILWGASLNGTLLKLNTNTLAIQVYNHAAYGSDYGIALGNDTLGNTVVYQAEYGSRTYIRFDSSSETFSTPAANKFPCLGIATDSKGNILASVYDTYGAYGVGSLAKFKPDGSLIWYAPAQVSDEARGTIVDSNDDVWVIHRPVNRMSKFRGSDGVPLGVFNTGDEPYTYSDATGLGLRSVICGIGYWTVVFDSGAADTPWGKISWYSLEPEGTSVTVKVRSSNDQISWSPWEAATNGVPLSTTPNGRYLEIEVTLKIITGDISPILYDLTVQTGVISVYVDIKPGSWPNPLNLASRGVLPVAICGTEDFDVTTIDVTTIKLTLEGLDDGVSPIRWAYEDVATPWTGEPGGGHALGGDGYLDLTLKFKTQEVRTTLGLDAFLKQKIPLIITGNLNQAAGGTPIKGQDYVWILNLPGDANDDLVVNIIDVSVVSAHWYPGPPIGPLGYDAASDLNGDGNINILDIALISSQWAHFWQP